MSESLVHIINDAFAISATENDFFVRLSERINELIVHDFDKVISILYRADVSEKKLQTLLAENKNADAGELIAGLFIERQLQKIKSRRESRRDSNDIADEDRW